MTKIISSLIGLGRKCENRDCNKEAENIHHKDRNRQNNHPSNLRYLCRSCHNREHVDDNPEHENSILFRSRDLVDDYAKGREATRLIWGFNLIKASELGYND